MIKVLRPSKNKQTQGYSTKHPAYDFSGRGDPNACSSIYGKVSVSKNSETKNWRNTGKLTTNDYGNYCKIEGQIDGKKVVQILAHLAHETVVKRGEEIKAGQVVGQIGNTGNSTAQHLHSEYRNEENKNIPVSFVNKIVEKTKMDTQPKDQIIRDAYFAITGEWPSEDELKARLQKNENTVELIVDLLKGDGKSKPRWLEIWKVEEKADETQINYEGTFKHICEILRPLGIKYGDSSEKVRGKLVEYVSELLELREKQVPKTKIIVAEEELTYITFLGLIIGYKK